MRFCCCFSSQKYTRKSIYCIHWASLIHLVRIGIYNCIRCKKCNRRFISPIHLVRWIRFHLQPSIREINLFNLLFLVFFSSSSSSSGKFFIFLSYTHVEHARLHEEWFSHLLTIHIFWRCETNWLIWNFWFAKVNSIGYIQFISCKYNIVLMWKT